MHMSAVHHLIGLILFHGNLSKTVSCIQLSTIVNYMSVIKPQGIVRLNHLQVCVSHQSIMSKMDEIAAGYEERVQHWKECLVKELILKCKHSTLDKITL